MNFGLEILKIKDKDKNSYSINSNQKNNKKKDYVSNNNSFGIRKKES